MSTSGERLAEQFVQANANFMNYVRTISADDWTRQCPGEGWTVGVVAHHIAEDHGVLADLVKSIADGAAVPEITADFINGLNADHAQRAVGCTREETLEVAQAQGARAEEMLRSLSEEQLARTAVMPVAGGEVTAATIAGVLLIGHIGMHVPSIEGAIAQATA